MMMVSTSKDLRSILNGDHKAVHLGKLQISRSLLINAFQRHTDNWCEEKCDPYKCSIPNNVSKAHDHHHMGLKLYCVSFLVSL